MNTKCNTCGGIYGNTLTDGSHYFHACAPIPNAAYQPDTTKPSPDNRQTIERPNKRDENIAGIDPVTKQPLMVSAGTGVTAV